MTAQADRAANAGVEVRVLRQRGRDHALLDIGLDENLRLALAVAQSPIGPT